MGNYKFRMSDMLPNSWFHKLKDMTKPKNKPSPPPPPPPKTNKKHSSESLPHHSSISYFSNNLGANPHYNSPRNSLYTKRSTRKSLYKPKLKPFTPPPRFVSAGFDKIKITGQDSSDSLFPVLESSSESFVYSFYGEEDDFTSSSGNDIIMDMKNKAFTKHKVQEIDVFKAVEKACPASNRIEKQQKTHLSVKIKQEDECRGHKGVSSGRKSFVNSQGFNLKRVNSPRIQISATRRSTSRSETKQVLESFAVMKRSVDPEKDFRESMVEMIAENKIKASKDLEDLLACYLTLNSKEYHDIIIQVFEQIWLQLTPKKTTK